MYICPKLKTLCCSEKKARKYFILTTLIIQPLEKCVIMQYVYCIKNPVRNYCIIEGAVDDTGSRC